MNKKIFIGLVALSAIVALITVNVHLSDKSTTILDISLAQIEALADVESGLGGGGNNDPSYDWWSSMYLQCNYLDPSKGTYKDCFHPGYSSTCTSTSCRK